MADQKFTVEEILSEYGGSDPNTPSQNPTPSGKLEMHKMLSQTTANTKPRTERPTPFRRAEEESKINQIKRNVRTKSSRPDIEDSRAAAFQTLELMREKVSFVHSPALDPQTAPAQKNDRIDGYEGAVRVDHAEGEPETSYQPQIRTMEDSTRAKEEKKKSRLSRRKRRKKENRSQYRKDSFAPEEAPQGAGDDALPEPEDKPIFFDLHHAGAATAAGSEAKEAHDWRHRVPPLPHLRRKRKSTPAPETLTEEAPPVLHTPNNDSEIRANLRILRQTVLFRTAALAGLFLLGLLLSVAEGAESGLYPMLLSAIGVRGYSLIHLVLGVAAIAVAFPTVANGLRYLFTGKADSDSMAALPIAVATAGAAVLEIFPSSMERGEAHLFVPVGIFILFLNALGKQLIIRRAISNFSVIEKDYEQYVLTYVHHDGDAETLTRGVLRDYPILVSMRKAHHMSDFLRYTYSEDLGDRFCRKVAPVVAVASLLIAAAITGIRSTVMPATAVLGFFVSVLSMLLSGGCCAGLVLIANLPLRTASKRLSKKGCALLGYQSVDEFYDSNALLVSAAALFPESAVSVSGIKPFGDAKIEEVVVEAASLSRAADSVLQHAFSHMMPEEQEGMYPVENVQYEENYGLSGWIRNRRVLLGNRDMMVAHNIEGLPSPLREAEYAQEAGEVLYFSVSGILSAVIQVQISASAKMKRILQKMVEEKIALVVRSVDPFLTQQRIVSLYQIPEGGIKVIPLALQETFQRYTEPIERVSASIITSGQLEDTIALLIQARRIRHSAMTGIIFQAASVIIGFSVALIYIGLSAYTSVTSEMFLMFQIAASAITALVLKIK
jgi:Cu+-exporting ATPase